MGEARARRRAELRSDDLPDEAEVDHVHRRPRQTEHAYAVDEVVSIVVVISLRGVPAPTCQRKTMSAALESAAAGL